MGLKSDIKEVFLNNMTSGPTGRLKKNPHQEKKDEE